MKKISTRLLSPFLAMILLLSNAIAQKSDESVYRALITKTAGRLGITATDAADAVISHAYTDEKSGITYIYLQQAYQQVKVYNTIISAIYRNGELLYGSGSFVKNIAGKVMSAAPAKTYTEALQAAARHLQLNDAAPLSTIKDAFVTEKKYVVAAPAIARSNIDVTLYWTPSDDKERVNLTWNVNIDVKNSTDWWNVRMDALTGNFIEKDNWTVNEENTPDQVARMTGLPADQNQPGIPVNPAKKKIPAKNQSAPSLVLNAPPPNVTSATYRVIRFPFESPIHTGFTNEVNPWLLAGAGNPAITLGWHFDSVANYNITRGNNVFAFLDKTATNLPDAITNWPDTSTTPAPSLTFVNTFNPAINPDSISPNKKAALDNLFYWNNLMHDVTYQYGLTEASGNFQRENLGRGGVGNDWVNAQAQDGAGTNNANFATPTDGGNGRMRMYLWGAPVSFTVNTPAAISGSYPALESNFSTANKLRNTGPVTGQVVFYNDDASGTAHRACTPAANAADLAGKIALIYSPTCTYIIKAKNAQDAGAIGVIVYRAVVDPVVMGGTDNTITIPAINIGSGTAAQIINQLTAGTPVTATLRAGTDLDGDLDNGIICHEYGHGVSNRLTGGPFGSACLSNNEQGGEGWSDYLALMMTTNWATATVNDGPNPRPVGTYASAQTTSGTGIRRYPYSTNMTTYPLTYANVATSVVPHGVGEIWCATIWDMTWNIIQQTGTITPNLHNSAGTGGNIVAMNLVMTGMKLQPCKPGFLDARNAILAADSILYGYAHKCAIWNAFARRGMGFSASQGSSNSAIDQTVAFDLPTGIKLNQSAPLIVAAGTQTTITRTATCDCQATSFVMRDTIPSGFTYVSSSPSGTLSGNVLTFPSTAFTAMEAKNFTITLQAPASGCTIDSVLNDNRESSTTGGFTSSGTSTWTPSTVRAHTPTSSWYAPNLTTAASASLTSAATATTAAKPLSILSFWQNFRTETTFDGGVIEYSTNGSTWTDAAPLFLGNNYNNLMVTGTALAGRRAFSGNSQGFEPVLVNVSSFGTTPVQFRFRMETDAGVGVEGWYVDDIIRANGCGGIMRSGIYTAVGSRADSTSVPVFVTPPALPLTLLWFYASQVGSQVALDWKTVSEVNVKDFTIEWSTDGATWTTIGSSLAQNRNTNDYSFVHATPANGNNYYRIKMNDIDGRYTYAPVRLVKMETKGQPMVILVPNPVNTDAVLYVSKDAKAGSVKIYNAAGSLVRQLTVGTGVQQLKINTATLADGIYTIETVGEGRHITRMIVQH